MANQQVFQTLSSLTQTDMQHWKLTYLTITGGENNVQNAVNGLYFPSTTADGTLKILNSDNGLNFAYTVLLLYAEFVPDVIINTSYKLSFVTEDNTTTIQKLISNKDRLTYIHTKYFEIAKMSQQLINLLYTPMSRITVDGIAGKQTVIHLSVLVAHLLALEMVTAEDKDLTLVISTQNKIAPIELLLSKHSSQTSASTSITSADQQQLMNAYFVAAIKLTFELVLLIKLNELGVRSYNELVLKNAPDLVKKFNSEMRQLYNELANLCQNKNYDKTAIVNEFIVKHISNLLTKNRDILSKYINALGNVYSIKINLLHSAYIGSTTLVNTLRDLTLTALRTLYKGKLMTVNTETKQQSAQQTLPQTASTVERKTEPTTSKSTSSSDTTAQKPSDTKTTPMTDSSATTTAESNLQLAYSTSATKSTFADKLLQTYKLYKQLYKTQQVMLQERYNNASSEVVDNWGVGIVATSDDAMLTFARLLNYLDHYSSNKYTLGGITFKGDILSLFLLLKMLSGFIQSITDLVRILPRLALEFHVIKDYDFELNILDYLDTYYYPIVLSFNVVREAWNPVDVLFITVPSFNPNLLIPGYNQYAGGLYMSLDQLIQNGVDVSLLVGYSSERKDLERIFSGFIRQAQRNQDGTITLICEGYGLHLIRPIVTHDNAETGFFNDPRKLVYEAVRDTNNWNLGVIETTITHEVRKIGDQVVLLIELQNSNLSTNNKLKLAIDTYRRYLVDANLLAVLRTAPFAENIFYPDSYWPGLVQDKKQNDFEKMWEAFTKAFNIMKLVAGYSLWDIIYDALSLTSDFILAVEPIDLIAQARVFFGKPEFPFVYQYVPNVDSKYKPSIVASPVTQTQLQNALLSALQKLKTITDSLDKLLKNILYYSDFTAKVSNTQVDVNGTSASYIFALAVLGAYFKLITDILNGQFQLINNSHKYLVQALKDNIVADLNQLFKNLTSNDHIKNLATNVGAYLKVFQNTVGKQYEKLINAFGINNIDDVILEIITTFNKTADLLNVKANVKDVSGNIWYCAVFADLLNKYIGTVGNNTIALLKDSLTSQFLTYTNDIYPVTAQLEKQFNLINSNILSVSSLGRYNSRYLRSDQFFGASNINNQAFDTNQRKLYTFEILTKIVLRLPAALKNYETSIVSNTFENTIDKHIQEYVQTINNMAKNYKAQSKVSNDYIKKLLQQVNDSANKLYNNIITLVKNTYTSAITGLTNYYKNYNASGNKDYSKITELLTTALQITYTLIYSLKAAYDKSALLIQLFNELAPLLVLYRKLWLNFLVYTLLKQICVSDILYNNKKNCKSFIVNTSFLSAVLSQLTGQNLKKLRELITALQSQYEQNYSVILQKFGANSLITKLYFVNHQLLMRLLALINNYETEHASYVSGGQRLTALINIQSADKSVGQNTVVNELSKLFNDSKADIKALTLLTFKMNHFTFDSKTTTFSISANEIKDVFYDLINIVRNQQVLQIYSDTNQDKFYNLEEVIYKVAKYLLIQNNNIATLSYSSLTKEFVVNPVADVDADVLDIIAESTLKAFKFFDKNMCKIQYVPNNASSTKGVTVTELQLLFLLAQLSGEYLYQLLSSADLNIRNAVMTNYINQKLFYILKSENRGLSDELYASFTMDKFLDFLRHPLTVHADLYSGFARDVLYPFTGNQIFEPIQSTIDVAKSKYTLKIIDLAGRLNEVAEFINGIESKTKLIVPLLMIGTPAGLLKILLLLLTLLIVKRVQPQKNGSDIRFNMTDNIDGIADDYAVANGALLSDIAKSFLPIQEKLMKIITVEYSAVKSNKLPYNLKELIQKYDLTKNDAKILLYLLLAAHSMLITQILSYLAHVYTRIRTLFYIQALLLYLISDSYIQIQDMEAFTELNNFLQNAPFNLYVKLMYKLSLEMYSYLQTLYYYVLSTTATEVGGLLKELATTFDKVSNDLLGNVVDIKPKTEAPSTLTTSDYKDLLSTIKSLESNIQNMFSNMILKDLAKYLSERSKLFSLNSNKLFLSDTGPKLYPAGTKPFANYHYIYSNEIIRNDIKLNTKVVNHVVLYLPTMLGAIPIVGKLLEWLLQFVLTITPSNTTDVGGNPMTVTELFADDDIPTSLLNTQTVQTLALSIPQMRILALTFYLKRGLQDMYVGQLVIIGKPYIKPFDYVYIEDVHNNMFGMLQVKAVNHIYSPDTGFVTLIQIMPIIITRDVHVSTFWYTALKIADIGTTVFFGFVKLGGQLIGKAVLKTGLMQAVKKFSRFIFLQQITNQVLKTLSVDSFFADTLGIISSSKNVEEGKLELVAMDKVVLPLVINVLKKDGMPFASGLTNLQYNKHTMKQMISERFETLRLSTLYYVQLIANVQYLLNDLSVFRTLLVL